MQFPFQNPPPTIPTEEDAFTFIIQALRDAKDNLENYGVRMSRIFDLYLKKVCGFQDHHIETGYGQIAPPFYAAAWELCRRGVLRPGVLNSRGHVTDYDDSYTVTSTGKKWLGEAGQHDCLPIESGRFSKQLDGFTPRFGAAFQERSQEAIRCYGASAYLGCCAMCGAATESISLAVAIAKDGDREKVEKAYLGNDGRENIKEMILQSQPENVQNECRGYLSLVKYWQDRTIQGTTSGITEGEAYTALALLLRFAHFANDRWDELTRRDRGGAQHDNHLTTSVSTKGNKCRACGSDKMIPTVELLGESVVSRVALTERHNAMPLDQWMEGKLEADLCGECGRISLRAANPSNLWDQYAESSGKRAQ